MALGHKPYTHVAIYDPTDDTTALSTTSPRLALPPDVSPTDFFNAGDGQRTATRKQTVWSCHIPDQDDIILLKGGVTGAIGSETRWAGLEGVDVNAIALSRDGRAMQWYQDAPLQVQEGELNYDSVQAILYSGLYAPAVYTHADLLEWTGLTVTSGVLDNWTHYLNGGGTAPTASVTSGVVTLTTNSSENGTDDQGIYIDIVIPFSDLAGLTLAWRITEDWTGISDTPHIEIEQYDNAGVIGTNNLQAIATGTGDYSVIVSSIDADIYKVRVRMDINNIQGTGNGTIKFEQPRLTFAF